MIKIIKNVKLNDGVPLKILSAGLLLTLSACSLGNASQVIDKIMLRLKISSSASIDATAPMPLEAKEDPVLLAKPGERELAYLVSLAAINSSRGTRIGGVPLIQQAAQQGNAEAQSELGERYISGWGVSKDQSLARQWFEKAASQEEPYAQFALGGIYMLGNKGVAKDYSKAVYWFEKSAAQGYPPAQAILGAQYSKGHGVQKDYVKARKLYEAAAAKNDSSAKAFLAYMYWRGEGVEPDPLKGLKWMEAAAKGEPLTMGLLGAVYLGGQFGVAQDPIKAKEWFRKSCDGDVGPSCDMLAKIQPAPAENRTRPSASSDATAQYANNMADLIVAYSSNIACAHIARTIRIVGSTQVESSIRMRQVESMIDKIPDICLPSDFG